MKYLIIMVAGLAVAACNPQTRIVSPGDERLQCASEPAALTPPISDADDTAYKIALRAAWFDCHNAVGWLRDWFGAVND